MKLYRILGGVLSVGAAAMLPQFAFATSTISGPALGTVDAIYDFCIKVDPDDAANFRAQEASLVNGISPKTVSGVHGGSDFKKAYDFITDLLNKMPKHDLAKTCAAGVTKQEVEGKPDDKGPDDKKPDDKKPDAKRGTPKGRPVETEKH
jgi:hypothetical protein